MTNEEKLELRLMYLEKTVIELLKTVNALSSKADTTQLQTTSVNDILLTSNEVTYTNTDDILLTQEGLAVTYESMETNSEDITTCQEAIAEIYEIILSEEDTDQFIEDMFTDTEDPNFDDVFKEE